MGDALHTHGGVTSALEARLAQGGLLAVDGSGALDVRTGVLHGPGSTAVVSGTSSTSPWRYQVAAHNPVMSRGAANGAYLAAHEAAAFADTTAPPASNSRIDVIWSKQQDSQAGIPTPDGVIGFIVGCTQGSAAASPVAPAIPVGAVELARAVVLSTATGGTSGTGTTITHTGRQTVARGAPIPVRNQTERDAMTPFAGMLVSRLDLGGILEQYSGSAWWRYARKDDLSTASITPSGTWADTGSGGFVGLSVHKNALGEVQCHGEIGKPGGGGAVAETIATIPAGFRPASAESYNVGTRSGTPLQVYVTIAGEIKLHAVFGGSIAAISLSNIRYLAA